MTVRKSRIMTWSAYGLSTPSGKARRASAITASATSDATGGRRVRAGAGIMGRSHPRLAEEAGRLHEQDDQEEAVDEQLLQPRGHVGRGERLDRADDDAAQRRADD